MRTQFGTILAAARRLGTAALPMAVATSATLPFMLSADEPVATSADCVYAADATPSPRAVKTAAELGEITGGTWKVAWRAGETVTVSAPDGAVTTLVSDAATAGTATLALGSAGCWTLTRTGQGMLHDTAEITVRYALYGSAGTGTEADPLKVVDAEEIAAIDGETATSGLHIALRGADGLDLATLALGSGLSLTGLGDGVWRIDAAADGKAATSAATLYLADTRPSPRAVKTAAEQGEITGGTWKATRRADESVTLVSPGGTRTTLMAANSAATSAALPLNAGGVWTVENSAQGTAIFTVRRSLDGTLGDGTAASPAKLVDGDELRDYGAGENYTFTLDGVDGLLSRLVLPAGCRLEEAGDGVWKIVASADGSQYSWAEIAYSADSVQEGPDRKTSKKDALPVAYTGDNWLGDAAKAATVVFTSPSGAATTLNLTGTGAQSFTFDSPGKWTVTLTMADGTTRTAVISVSGGLTIIIC